MDCWTDSGGKVTMRSKKRSEGCTEHILNLTDMLTRNDKRSFTKGNDVKRIIQIPKAFTNREITLTMINSKKVSKSSAATHQNSSQPVKSI